MCALTAELSQPLERNVLVLARHQIEDLERSLLGPKQQPVVDAHASDDHLPRHVLGLLHLPPGDRVAGRQRSDRPHGDRGAVARNGTEGGLGRRPEPQQPHGMDGAFRQAVHIFVVIVGLAAARCLELPRLRAPARLDGFRNRRRSATFSSLLSRIMA
jgi:hypothetical protein